MRREWEEPTYMNARTYEVREGEENEGDSQKNRRDEEALHDLVVKIM
jgi:hypothetical protein